MQFSIWTWAKIHILRYVVTATIATGAFQGFLLDLTVTTPGFLKSYVKESNRCVGGEGGGGAGRRGDGGRRKVHVHKADKTLSNPRNMSLFSTVSRKRVLKNINSILQSPNIY